MTYLCMDLNVLLGIDSHRQLDIYHEALSLE